MFLRVVVQICYALLIIMEALLSLRFILKLFNVPGTVPIVAWLYGGTDPLLYPLRGIVPDAFVFLGFTIETITLLALFIITVFAYAAYEIIKALS